MKRLLDLRSDLMGSFGGKYTSQCTMPRPSASSKGLMEANGFKTVDLANGLSGREQTKRLGERFKLSPAAFL
jgi:hypothetical protein